MVTLYTADPRSEGAEIRDALEAMCLAHRIVTLHEGDLTPAELPPDARPPVLVDNGEAFQGKPAILAHLQEMEKFVAQWRKYQSDVCYCDYE